MKAISIYNTADKMASETKKIVTIAYPVEAAGRRDFYVSGSPVESAKLVLYMGEQVFEAFPVYEENWKPKDYVHLDFFETPLHANLIYPNTIKVQLSYDAGKYDAPSLVFEDLEPVLKWSEISGPTYEESGVVYYRV